MNNTQSLPIIDAHTHLEHSIREMEGLEKYLNASGLKGLNIACCPAGISCWAEVHTPLMALLLKALYPGKIYVFGGLDYTLPGYREGKVDFADQARNLVGMGADGIKMLEGKPDTRKALGIPLDSPVFDGFYAFMQDKELPLLCHVADPETFWDPETVPSAVKDSWFWGDGSHLSKEQIYAEMEGVLKKFPGLRVIFAHFLFLSADLQRASRFLDTWPSVNLDITPGVEMYRNFAARSVAWREFFTRYQDRIILGTDSDIRVNEDGTIDQKKIGEDLQNLTTIVSFLATEKAMCPFMPAGKAICRGQGLRLDAPVLRKILATNFQRLAGATPRKADTGRMLSEGQKLLRRIGPDPSQARIVTELQELLVRIQRVEESIRR